MVELILKDQIEFGISPLNITTVCGLKYWKKIITNKHPEANLTQSDIRKTITDPEYIFKSQHSQNVYLYSRKISSRTTIAVVKHLPENYGILLTAYKKTNKKLNKEIIWQK